MTRLEMIEFIKKYSSQEHHFPHYDDQDLFRMCSALTWTNADAKREFYDKSSPFRWYYKLIDWLFDRNIFCKFIGWILIFAFNPMCLFIYFIFGILLLLMECNSHG